MASADRKEREAKERAAQEAREKEKKKEQQATTERRVGVEPERCQEAPGFLKDRGLT